MADEIVFERGNLINGYFNYLKNSLYLFEFPGITRKRSLFYTLIIATLFAYIFFLSGAVEIFQDLFFLFFIGMFLILILAVTFFVYFYSFKKFSTYNLQKIILTDKSLIFLTGDETTEIIFENVHKIEWSFEDFASPSILQTIYATRNLFSFNKFSFAYVIESGDKKGYIPFDLPNLSYLLNIIEKRARLAKVAHMKMFFPEWQKEDK